MSTTTATAPVLSVANIARQLGIDPKRARRIMRKADASHEHGTAWELDAKGAARVRNILIEKMVKNGEAAPAPTPEPKAKRAKKTALVAKDAPTAPAMTKRTKVAGNGNVPETDAPKAKRTKKTA